MVLQAQALRFLASAVAGLSIGLFWAWFFHEWVGWSKELAAALSMILVSTQNFLVFLFWVYKPDHRKPMARMVIGFALSVLAFRGAEFVFFLLFCTVMGFHYLLVLIFLRGMFMIVKFFFYRGTLFASRAPGEHAA